MRVSLVKPGAYLSESYEYVGVKQIIVPKRDGRVELFKRAKVATGLELAFAKLGVDPAYLETLVDNVCERIHGSGKREVSSEEIGRVVLDELLKDSRDESKVAYVRFASVFLYVRRREDLIELVSKTQEKVCGQQNQVVEVS